MSDGKPVPKPTARPRFRSLTPDEEKLWSVVARTVRPLRPGAFGLGALFEDPAAVVAEKNTIVPETPRPAKNGAAGARKGAAPNLRLSSPHRSGQPALSPIMRKEKQKIARGHAAIDARIDLHGMTQTEAHAALRNLLQRAQANGAKFVLVITGKGLPNSSLNGRGVLRRQVPQWLSLPEFRRYVAGFDVANAGHGGEGALYVRLRKTKALD
jgi:DNA-nicking Smr family endonuclease